MGGRKLRPRSTRAPPTIVYVFAALLTAVQCAPDGAAGPPPPAFFVFGDSYADTGNRARSGPYEGSGWKEPYGSTWPGHPSGRYGNGLIQTDLLADLIGVPLPPLYTEAQASGQGVNFAVGGSGVMYAWGFAPLGAQVDDFEALANAGAFDPAVLARSVALVSEVGNDYASFVGGTKNLVGYAHQVVEGIAVNVRRLHRLGLRNVMVANLGRLDCIPGATKANNYTACVAADLPAVAYHNALLADALAKLAPALPGARFLVLDQFSAFSHVLNKPDAFGMKEALVPCCKGLTTLNYCGDVDSEGNPLYTLCPNPEQHTFWDTAHPTESTWKAIMRLYTSGFNTSSSPFVQGAPNLMAWLTESNTLAAVAPPGPLAVKNEPGTANAEFQEAVGALALKSNYSEALGLLNSIDFDVYLATRPGFELVTTFVPNNDAFLRVAYTKVDQIYCENRLYDVLEYHAVWGYHGGASLRSKPQNRTVLTTLSGVQLDVKRLEAGVMVGASGGYAFVVDPDLYITKSGAVVVHGIDRLLSPPKKHNCKRRLCHLT